MFQEEERARDDKAMQKKLKQMRKNATGGDAKSLTPEQEAARRKIAAESKRAKQEANDAQERSWAHRFFLVLLYLPIR